MGVSWLVGCVGWGRGRGEGERGESWGSPPPLRGTYTHFEGHDRRVRDVDLADQVGSVGGVGGELDAEGGDGESGEGVEACDGDLNELSLSIWGGFF